MSCFLYGNKLLTASIGVVRFCTSLHKHYAARILFCGGWLSNMVCKKARHQFRAKAYSKEEKLMNQTTTNELKSEKLKLGKVFLIIWLVAIVAFFQLCCCQICRI